MQAESEQTNSALALGVCIGRDLRVKSAGGYLVQVGTCSDAAAAFNWVEAILPACVGAHDGCQVELQRCRWTACGQCEQVQLDGVLATGVTTSRRRRQATRET